MTHNTGRSDSAFWFLARPLIPWVCGGDCSGGTRQSVARRIVLPAFEAIVQVLEFFTGSTSTLCPRYKEKQRCAKK